MRHHLAAAVRLPLLPPACASTVVTCCPRLPHGFRWQALRKPSCRESDDGLLQGVMAVRPSCPDQDLEVTKSRVPSAPRPLWLRGASRLTATICGRSDADQEAP